MSTFFLFLMFPMKSTYFWAFDFWELKSATIEHIKKVIFMVMPLKTKNLISVIYSTSRSPARQVFNHTFHLKCKHYSQKWMTHLPFKTRITGTVCKLHIYALRTYMYLQVPVWVLFLFFHLSRMFSVRRQFRRVYQTGIINPMSSLKCKHYSRK